MSWNTDEEYQKYRERGSAFVHASQEERDRVTDEEAESYILPDTISGATWDRQKVLRAANGWTLAQTLDSYFETYFNIAVYREA